MIILELQIIQLCDLLNEFGEESVRDILADFLCPLNEDVEFFLKHKAILFENMDKSRTYLVFGIDDAKMILVAYFSLTSLPIVFDNSISNKRKKAILRTGFEANSQLSAILIGQFGKNYKNCYNLLITGKDLFDLTMHKVLQVHKLIGGRIIYLECENRPKLRAFYEKVGFELYTDDNGDPIISDTGLLTYMISTKNISLDKYDVRERIHEIMVTT